MSKEDSVDLPFKKRIQKFFCNIFGRPFIYVEFDYEHNTEMLAVLFDYNNPMLNRIRQAGYDDDDPDDAMRHYIQHVMIVNSDMLYEDGDADDGTDPDYDEEYDGEYIHSRGN
jgi:hypothetical protein